MVTLEENSWLESLKDLLVELARSEVVEFELVQAGTRIYLRKHGQQSPVGATTACAPSTAGGPPVPQKPPEANHNGYIPICTPLTGVFYSASSPGTAPYVRVGDWIEAGQVVGLVEAMKAFNEIRAESRGRVVAILAQNGQLVQKNQALLHLDKE